MTKNGVLEHPTKIKNFPNLMIFDQKTWTKIHETDQNLCFFEKNFVFEKIENPWLLTKIYSL